METICGETGLEAKWLAACDQSAQAMEDAQDAASVVLAIIAGQIVEAYKDDIPAVLDRRDWERFAPLVRSTLLAVHGTDFDFVTEEWCRLRWEGARTTLSTVLPRLILWMFHRARLIDVCRCCGRSQTSASSGCARHYYVCRAGSQLLR